MRFNLLFCVSGMIHPPLPIPLLPQKAWEERVTQWMCITQWGFHLIEILITLVIVFILVTMSLPIYSHYMVSARRLAAETALSTLAIAMERYHFLHDSYENATLEQLHLQKTANAQDYQLQIQYADQQTYQIAAMPQNNQAQKDQRCGALILNEKGERSVTGSGAREECW